MRVLHIALLAASILFSVINAFDAGELTANDDDRLNWIDPNDPTAHLLLAPRPDAIQQCISRDDTADPVLKLILRNLLRQLNVDPSLRTGFYRTASVRLGDFEMNTLQDYLESSHSTGAQRESVRNALKDMMQIIDHGLDGPSKIQLLLLAVEPWLLPLNILLATVATVFFLTKLFSSGSLIRMLILLLFIASLFTSYNRMYQERMAARIAANMERSDACRPQGLWERSFGYLSGLVSVSKKSDCLKFIEAQTVSVMFEIGPMDVLFDVLGNSVFSLMEHFATRLNRAAVSLYDGLPLHLQLGVTLAVLLVFLVVFFFGIVQYRVGFFGLRFEPAHAHTGLVGQVGAAVGGIIDALEPRRGNDAAIAAHALPSNQDAVAPEYLIDKSRVTPRTKQRIERILQGRNALALTSSHDHHDPRKRSPSPSPRPRRSFSASRIH